MNNINVKQNLLIRLAAVAFVLSAIVFFHQEFYKQFRCYLTGQANIITAEWHIVALNIILFLLLAVPLFFRRTAKWGEYGVIAAFFISLFVEMYGFPLTIYFAVRYFSTPVVCAEPVLNFEFFGVGFGMEVAMVYAAILIAVGSLLIGIGWLTLYFNYKKMPFVNVGIYRYSRHPQYLGFILIVAGWLIDWPTLITLIFAPILIYKYVMVCRAEEKELLAKYPEYDKYREIVPYFI